jgi:2-phospho-L-lactate guanylyltransferase (CobY/MobA/RfbA family)
MQPAPTLLSGRPGADKQGVGTTALLLPARTEMQFMFGQDRLARHRNALREQHMRLIEWNYAALAFDLDTPADYLLGNRAQASRR